MDLPEFHQKHRKKQRTGNVPQSIHFLTFPLVRKKLFYYYEPGEKANSFLEQRINRKIVIIIAQLFLRSKRNYTSHFIIDEFCST